MTGLGVFVWCVGPRSMVGAEWIWGRLCGSILVAALPETSNAVHRGKGIEEAAVALVRGDRGGEFVTVTRDGKPIAVPMVTRTRIGES